MVFIAELCAVWQRVNGGHGSASGRAGSMHAAMNERRLASDILHDVNLTTHRPSHRPDTGAKQPKGRPYSLTKGNLDSGLEFPILLREFSRRFQSSRGVITGNTVRAGEGFPPRGNDQVTIL